MNSVMNEEEKKVSDHNHERLRRSYVQARKQLALQEIELNRVHIVIVSQEWGILLGVGDGEGDN